MAKQKSEYSEKLRDPRWQKQRLKIMERDDFACQICFDTASTLNVHHRWYDRGKEPWDYPEECLVTLCETCHQTEYESRYENEQMLIRAMKRNFFSADLNVIACAFGAMQLLHIPDVVSEAIAFALTNEDAQQAMIDTYMADVKKRTSQD